MRLRHIEVFHAVYASGSMTKAAQMLNVSQPSISKVLAHAELQIGYRLFDRSRGKLSPTPEAVRLYDHVRQIHEDLARLKRVAENLREASSGTLRIACTPTLGIELLPAVVGDFLRGNADTYIEIETLHLTEMAEALSESRIDLGFAFDADYVGGLNTVDLATGRFVFIAPQYMAAELGETIQLSALAGMPFVRLNTRGPLGQSLDAHISSLNVEFNVVAGAETYQVAASLVGEGLGVSVVDEITAKAFAGNRVAIRQLEPELTFRICALHQQSQASLLEEKFLRFFTTALHAHLADP